MLPPKMCRRHGIMGHRGGGSLKALLKHQGEISSSEESQLPLHCSPRTRMGITISSLGSLLPSQHHDQPQDRPSWRNTNASGSMPHHDITESAQSRLAQDDGTRRTVGSKHAVLQKTTRAQLPDDHCCGVAGWHPLLAWASRAILWSLAREPGTTT